MFLIFFLELEKSFAKLRNLFPCSCWASSFYVVKFFSRWCTIKIFLDFHIIFWTCFVHLTRFSSVLYYYLKGSDEPLSHTELNECRMVEYEMLYGNVLCILTSKCMLAHASAWSKTIKTFENYVFLLFSSMHLLVEIHNRNVICKLVEIYKPYPNVALQFLFYLHLCTCHPFLQFLML